MVMIVHVGLLWSLVLFDLDDGSTRNNLFWLILQPVVNPVRRMQKPLFWRSRFLAIVFQREKNYTAALCIFSLIIVKSLQLRGRWQIAEPCKYCLVCVIIFLWLVFSRFCFSQVWKFCGNSLQLVSKPKVRFEWEQWQRKQERRLKQKSSMAQTLDFGGCKSRIIFMGRSCICRLQGKNPQL